MPKFIVQSLDDAGPGAMELRARIEGVTEQRKVRVQTAFMMLQQAASDGKWDFFEILTCGSALKSALSD